MAAAVGEIKAVTTLLKFKVRRVHVHAQHSGEYPRHRTFRRNIQGTAHSGGISKAPWHTRGGLAHLQANVLAPESVCELTPLHWAAYGGHNDCLREMLKAIPQICCQHITANLKNNN